MAVMYGRCDKCNMPVRVDLEQKYPNIVKMQVSAVYRVCKCYDDKQPHMLISAK